MFFDLKLKYVFEIKFKFKESTSIIEGKYYMCVKEFEIFQEHD